MCNSKQEKENMRWTNEEINRNLGALRDQIRDGKIKVSVKSDPTAVRFAVAQALGISPDSFNTANFNPQTLRRFSHFFDTRGLTPTQDQIARAMTHFINRRFDPWFHAEPKPVTATSAEPFAQYIKDADEGEDTLGEVWTGSSNV